jgi:aryl sulfotransferase
MVILQAGLPKSGNLWTYKILQNIAKYGNWERCSFIKKQPIYELAKTWELGFTGQAGVDVLDIEQQGCFCRIGPVFSQRVENIENYISQCNHVWTHSPFCKHSLEVLPRFDKVVYIIRDPRDVALSWSRFAFTPYMLKYHPHSYETPEEFLEDRLERIVRSWVNHVGGYLKHKNELNIHVVFYERLLHRFQQTLGNLLNYLELELDDQDRAEIRQAVAFKTMRNKNPDHVRKGKSYKWEDGLNEEQKSQVEEIAGSMLRLLNYPVEEDSLSKNVTPLPRVPSHLRKKEVDEAMKINVGSSSYRRVLRLTRKVLARLFL